MCVDAVVNADPPQASIEISNVYVRWFGNGRMFNINDVWSPDYTIDQYALLALQEILDENGSVLGSEVVRTAGNPLPFPDVVPEAKEQGE